MVRRVSLLREPLHRLPHVGHVRGRVPLRGLERGMPGQPQQGRQGDAGGQPGDVGVAQGRERERDPGLVQVGVQVVGPLLPQGGEEVGTRARKGAQHRQGHGIDGQVFVRLVTLGLGDGQHPALEVHVLPGLPLPLAGPEAQVQGQDRQGAVEGRQGSQHPALFFDAERAGVAGGLRRLGRSPHWVLCGVPAGRGHCPGVQRGQEAPFPGHAGRGRAVRQAPFDVGLHLGRVDRGQREMPEGDLEMCPCRVPVAQRARAVAVAPRQVLRRHGVQCAACALGLFPGRRVSVGLRLRVVTLQGGAGPARGAIVCLLRLALVRARDGLALLIHGPHAMAAPAHAAEGEHPALALRVPHQRGLRRFAAWGATKSTRGASRAFANCSKVLRCGSASPASMAIRAGWVMPARAASSRSDQSRVSRSLRILTPTGAMW